MQKALGIAALVIAIVAIFVPVYGPWVTVLAAGLAAFAFGPGFGLGLAAIILNVCNVIFMSPSIYLQGLGRSMDGEGKSVYTLVFAIVLVQVAAGALLMYLHRKQKVAPT